MGEHKRKEAYRHKVASFLKDVALLPTEVDKTERAIEFGKKRTGRECGECSLCCKVIPIYKKSISAGEEDVSKPADEWCKHCRPGCGGCSIYPNRPKICRGFACNWLIDISVPEYWRPTESKIVMHFRKGEDDKIIFNICVDTEFPNAWRQEPYYSDILKFSRKGLEELGEPVGPYAFVEADELAPQADIFGGFWYVASLPAIVIPSGQT